MEKSTISSVTATSKDHGTNFTAPSQRRPKDASTLQSCSQCRSCTSSCPCAAAQHRLTRLEKEVAKEQSAHEQAQQQLQKASHEIEILRAIVERRLGKSVDLETPVPQNSCSEVKNSGSTASSSQVGKIEKKSSSQVHSTVSSATIHTTSSLFAPRSDNGAARVLPKPPPKSVTPPQIHPSQCSSPFSATPSKQSGL